MINLLNEISVIVDLSEYANITEFISTNGIPDLNLEVIYIISKNHDINSIRNFLNNTSKIVYKDDFKNNLNYSNELINKLISREYVTYIEPKLCNKRFFIDMNTYLKNIPLDFMLINKTTKNNSVLKNNKEATIKKIFINELYSNNINFCFKKELLEKSLIKNNNLKDNENNFLLTLINDNDNCLVYNINIERYCLNEESIYENISLKKSRDILKNVNDSVDTKYYFSLFLDALSDLFWSFTENNRVENYDSVKKIISEIYSNNSLKTIVDLDKSEYSLIQLIGKHETYYDLKKNLIKKNSEKYAITVIIPIFNAEEKYLKKSFDSLLNQTFGFEKLEIIYIDDNSSNKEGINFIKNKMLKYPNIKLIFLKENKGSGNARNHGISIAKGKYIMFLDHDDYYFDDACEFLYNTIEKEKSQVVSGNFLENGTKINWNARRIYENIRIEKLSENMNLLLLPPSIWAKIFEKKFLINENIHFRNFKVGEDLIFTQEALLKAKGIIFVDKAVLNYQYRIGVDKEHSSISSNNSFKTLKTLLIVYEHMFKTLQNYDLTHSFIVLSDQINYWINSRLVKSDLTYEEFKEICEIGHYVFLNYLSSYNNVECKRCVDLFYQIISCHYIEAYKYYEKSIIRKY